MSENFKRLDDFKLPEEFFREHFVDVTLTSIYKDLFNEGSYSYTLFWNSEYSHYFDKFFFIGISPNINLMPLSRLPLDDFNNLNYVIQKVFNQSIYFDILISDEISSEFLLRWK
mgnify:CR=1 FL=1